MSDDQQTPATPAKTGMGLDPNVAGLLCYLAGWITGLVFFLLEKENRFVRFHAMQSLVTFGGIMALYVVLAFVPFIGGILSMLLGLVQLALWVLLMVKAYQGELFKLPVVGDIAEKQIG